MPKVTNIKKRKPQRKPKQKQKQKQIVKQNVKVNVQSSGGSGGGGSSIPTIPQYIPQPYAIPQPFRDTRGEDVVLQKLSEVVNKFNEKPQPTQALAPEIPFPMEYNDSAVDANQNNQLVAAVYQSKPRANENLLSELPFNNDPMFDVLNSANQSKPKINVLRDNVAIGKKAAETRRRNKEARAAAANNISFEPEEDAGIETLQESLTAAEAELKSIAPTPVKQRVADIEKKSPMKTRSRTKKNSET